MTEQQDDIFCGAHGCVLKYCCLQDECINGINKITKIFFNETDRNEEVETYKTINLNSIDKELQYFIGDAVSCDINIEKITDSNLIKIAEKMNTTTDELKENNTVFNGISYTDGGLSLIKYIQKLTSIAEHIELLKYLKNVFDGIQILHSNGIYHLDLKPDNIVIGEINNITTCRLIDFGDSFQSEYTKQTGISKTKQKQLLKNNRSKLSERLTNKDKIGTLEYMSPEMFILSHKTLRQELGKNNINIENKNRFIEGQQSEIDSNYLPIVDDYSSNLKHYINNILRTNIIETRIDYFNIIEELKSDIKILTPETVRIKYNKSDIWSLGIILVFIYSLMEQNIKEDQEQKESILNLLKTLILKLLIINPTKRPDASESVKLYNEFIEELNGKINTNNIKGGYKSKHNKSKHNKSKHNKSKHNKSKHNKSKNNKTKKTNLYKI